MNRTKLHHFSNLFSNEHTTEPHINCKSSYQNHLITNSSLVSKTTSFTKYFNLEIENNDFNALQKEKM